MGVELAVTDAWAGAACLSLLVLALRMFRVGKSG